MRYLEELEHKVLRLIQRNQELKAQLDATTKEIDHLRDKTRQYEASLLKETTASQTLAQEKAAIVNSIEALLNCLNALENAY